MAVNGQAVAASGQAVAALSAAALSAVAARGQVVMFRGAHLAYQTVSDRRVASRVTAHMSRSSIPSACRRSSSSTSMPACGGSKPSGSCRTASITPGATSKGETKDKGKLENHKVKDLPEKLTDVPTDMEVEMQGIMEAMVEVQDIKGPKVKEFTVALGR